MIYPTLLSLLLRLCRSTPVQAQAPTRHRRRRHDLQRRRLSQSELCLALRGQRRPGASI